MKESKTASGIKIISIIYVVLLVFIVILVPVLYNFSPGGSDVFPFKSADVDDDNDVFPFSGTFCGVFFILFLVSMLGIVIYIIGVVKIFLGRNEFGEEHRKFVMFGLIFLIGGIAIIFIPVINSISGLIQGIGMVCLIYSIAKKQQRLFLISSCFLLSITFILTAILDIGIYLDTFSRGLKIGVYIGSWVFMFIAYIFLVLGYSGTYKGIMDGSITPVISKKSGKKGKNRKKKR